MANPNKKITFSDIFGPEISEKEALKRIRQDPSSLAKFNSYNEEQQETILHFIMGKRGLYITYDAFFLKILSPYDHPVRIERFLSAFFGQRVSMVEPMPREGIRANETASFVVMDILIRMNDGSFVNVEMQRQGLSFPGERADCYISDLIMRQYYDTKKEMKANDRDFTFNDLKPVHLIVLMEKSPRVLKAVAPHYIHRKKTCYDSGAQITSLSNITFISLDTFQDVMQNKYISTELDAWLTFFCTTDPDRIIALIRQYPEFLTYYREIAAFRSNVKEFMTMYSPVLDLMDRNLIYYMFDEAKAELAEVEAAVAEARKTAAEAQAEAAEAQAEAAEAQAEVAEVREAAAEAREEAAEAREEAAEAREEAAEAREAAAEEKNRAESYREKLIALGVDPDAP